MFKKFKYNPKTKEELINIIKKEIYEVQETKDKPNWNANLNHINTKFIKDMLGLFSDEYGLEEFNGNISKWEKTNIKNIRYMNGIFHKSKLSKNPKKTCNSPSL